MPNKQEIIYPIFLDCCHYAKESFWKHIFEDLAYGKTPYGTYITKDFLCCKYKSKEFSYKIENKDVEILYNDIYNLLSNKFGLLSENEQFNKRIKFHSVADNIIESRNSWSNIRKKNVKDLLLELYVLNMKRKYNLSIKQGKYLRSLIFIGLVLKVFTSKDIIYDNNEIKDIKGIEFENNKIIVKKKMYDITNNIIYPNVIIEKKYMFDSWEKYLREIEKINNYIK